VSAIALIATPCLLVEAQWQQRLLTTGFGVYGSRRSPDDDSFRNPFFLSALAGTLPTLSCQPHNSFVFRATDRD
jgi:hypothetical protein